MNSEDLVNNIKKKLEDIRIQPKNFIAYYCMTICNNCGKTHNVLYNIDDLVLSDSLDEENKNKISECQVCEITTIFGTCFRNNRIKFNRYDNDSYLNFLFKLLAILEREIITVPNIE